MEAVTGRKRRGHPQYAAAHEDVVTDHEPAEVDGAAAGRCEGKAEGGVRRGGDQPAFAEEEVDEDTEAAELDDKVEGFFEIMRRIWDMKDSWRRASKRPCHAAAPPSPRTEDPHPPWTPMFCSEDFASARSSTDGKGNQAAAAAAHPQQKEGPILVDDNNHKCASPVTHHQRNPDGGYVAASHVAQSKGNCVVSSVEHSKSTTGQPASLRPVDGRTEGAEEGRGATGSRAFGVGGGSSSSRTGLELKLALW